MTEENGNGKVTLALLGQKLDALIETFNRHDARQEDQFNQVWKYIRDDHEILVTLPCEYHERDLAKQGEIIKGLREKDQDLEQKIDNKTVAIWKQLNLGKVLAGLMTAGLALLGYISSFKL
jgi:hypothetical protein